MTAICGIWNRTGQPSEHGTIERMARALHIYGPDNNTYWRGADIALARQLSHTLREDRFDRQPLVGGDGRFVLIADARIDNRDELSRSLHLPHDQMRCDAAYILAAYEKWGKRCTDHLVGDYCFALWDNDARQLTLVRDPFGRRPLYYYNTPEMLAFSSMPKGLHALPFVPYEANAEFFIQGLMYLKQDPHESCFGGIQKVAPGECMVVHPGHIQQSQNWKPPENELRFSKDTDYVEAMREQFGRAVTRQIRGETRIGSHLSGGLDSSGVTATAAGVLSHTGQVYAYTSVPRGDFKEADFNNRFSDEGGHAAATANLYPNVVHKLIHTPDATPIDDLDKSFYYNEHPLTNPCNNVWMEAINGAVKADGMSTLLIGSAGNLSATHAGWDAFAALLRAGQWRRLSRLAHAVSRQGKVRHRTIIRQTFEPLLPQVLQDFFAKRLRSGTLAITQGSPLKPERKAEQLDGDDPREYRAGIRSAVADMPRARIDAMRPDGGAELEKGTLARWKIDVRDPFTDRNLVEFCLSIPPEKYILNGMPRGMARAVFADRLPDMVLRETRRGYQGADWHMSLQAHPDIFDQEISRIAASRSASSIIANKTLEQAAQYRPNQTATDAEKMAWRTSLLRGISAGHFLRKVSMENC